MHYACEKIVAARPEVQLEDAKLAFELFYKKLLMALKYTPKYKIKSDVTLIKASESVDMAQIFSDVYDLDKVSKNFHIHYQTIV